MTGGKKPLCRMAAAFNRSGPHIALHMLASPQLRLTDALLAHPCNPAPLLQLVPRHIVHKGQAETVVKLLARLMREHGNVNALLANACICLASLALQEGPSFEEISRQVGPVWGLQLLGVGGMCVTR